MAPKSGAGWFIIFGLFCVLPFEVDASNDQRFRMHLKYVQGFACGAPQPRLIKLDQHFKQKLTTSEFAVPESTVLHRCGADTGCCKNKRICKVAEEEEVELIFMVLDLKLNPEYRSLRFSNHTLCSCQSATDEIK